MTQLVVSFLYVLRGTSFSSSARREHRHAAFGTRYQWMDRTTLPPLTLRFCATSACYHYLPFVLHLPHHHTHTHTDHHHRFASHLMVVWFLRLVVLHCWVKQRAFARARAFATLLPRRGGAVYAPHLAPPHALHCASRAHQRAYAPTSWRAPPPAALPGYAAAPYTRRRHHHHTHTGMHHARTIAFLGCSVAFCLRAHSYPPLRCGSFDIPMPFSQPYPTRRWDQRDASMVLRQPPALRVAAVNTLCVLRRPGARLLKMGMI